jgi:hypothetical protein
MPRHGPQWRSATWSPRGHPLAPGATGRSRLARVHRPAGTAGSKHLALRAVTIAGGSRLSTVLIVDGPAGLPVPFLICSRCVGYPLVRGTTRIGNPDPWRSCGRRS